MRAPAPQERSCRDLRLAASSQCCECRRTDLDRSESCVFVGVRTLMDTRPYGFVSPSSTEELSLASHRLGTDITAASIARVVNTITPTLLSHLDEEQALIGALPSSPLVGFRTWTLDEYESCICCQKRILFVCVGPCWSGLTDQRGHLRVVRLRRVRLVLARLPNPRLTPPHARLGSDQHSLRVRRQHAMAPTLRDARGAPTACLAELTLPAARVAALARPRRYQAVLADDAEQRTRATLQLRLRPSRL